MKNYLMKNFYFFFFCGAVVFISITPFIFLKKQPVKLGYIPENEVQITKWVETNPGSQRYYLETKISVVTDKGDTITAEAIDPFPGAFMVINKDSYPPSKGKKVFVMLSKMSENDIIIEASLTPFKK